MQEMWVWSLGQEDPLVKEMATHSSILFFFFFFFTPVFLPGESHGQRSLTAYTPQGHKRVGHLLVTKQQQQQQQSEFWTAGFMPILNAKKLSAHWKQLVLIETLSAHLSRNRKS